MSGSEGLKVYSSELKTWTCCCVLGWYTLLSQHPSPLRIINGYCCQGNLMKCRGGGLPMDWHPIWGGGGVKPKPKNLLDQLDEKKITWANENSQWKQTNWLRSEKTWMIRPHLIGVLSLIGPESDVNYLDHSQSEVNKNQNNLGSPLTFNS